MAAEHPAHGEVAIGRIPGSLEMYLITRMTDWDGEVLPVVIGHARTRADAIAFACRETRTGVVWIDERTTADTYVLLRPAAV